MAPDFPSSSDTETLGSSQVGSRRNPSLGYPPVSPESWPSSAPRNSCSSSGSCSSYLCRCHVELQRGADGSAEDGPSRPLAVGKGEESTGQAAEEASSSQGPPWRETSVRWDPLPHFLLMGHLLSLSQVREASRKLLESLSYVPLSVERSLTPT